MSSHLSFSSNLRLQRLGAISPSCFQDTVHIDFVKKLLPSRKIVLQRIHQARISSLTQHSVEPHLLLSADENFIALWNTDLESINKVNGYIKPLFRVRGTTSASSRSARSFSSSAMLLSLHWFRKDPGIFFSGDSDGRLRVWDTSSASSVADIPLKEPIYQIDSNPLNPIQLAVARGTNIQVPIIDISVEHVVQTLSGHKKEIRSVVWNALGREKVRWDLCSGSLDGTVKLWDLRTSQAVFTLDPTRGRAGVYGINLTSDGQYLLVNTSRSTETWHIPSLKKISSLPFTPSRKGTMLPLPLPSSHVLFPSLSGALMVDSTLNSYFTLDSDQVHIYLQSYLDEKTHQTYQGSFSPITSITYSPFTMQLFTGSEDGSMVCFDITRNLYQTLKKKK